MRCQKICYLLLISLCGVVTPSSATSLVQTTAKIGGLCALAYFGYQIISSITQPSKIKKATKMRDYSDYGHITVTPILLSEADFKKNDEQLRVDARLCAKIMRRMEERKKRLSMNKQSTSSARVSIIGR